MSEALCTSELRAQFFTSIEGIYAHQKVTKEILELAAGIEPATTALRMPGSANRATPA